ncbi:Putative ParB-like protein [Pseudomonas putida S11]|nr:Putative ParB-like protein [Pseudomonas putida S11]
MGESAIPAVVVTAAEADRYLISLVENLARRKHSNRDLLMAINVLHERGYSIRQIAQKTCLDRAYVGGILILLRQGEERLIAAVEKGWLPIKVAIHVARSDDAQVQAAMVEAYESGLLKGDELIKVRRLIDRRRVLGKGYGRQHGGERMTTPRQLLTAYQTEVRRQRLMVKKADIGEQRLLFVVTALRRLLADEFFRSMLRSEGIDDMPQVLAERIQGGRMTVVKRAFAPELITVRLPLILPSRQVTHDMLTSVKFAAILASIRELGVVEPLAVYPEPVHGTGGEPRLSTVGWSFAASCARTVGGGRHVVPVGDR